MAKEGGRDQVVVEEPTRKGDPSVTVERIPDEDEDLEPDVTQPSPLEPERRFASSRG